MRDFIAIDFETANPGRVSACALGIAKVVGGTIVETKGHLIKPVGGHAPFQSKIHGIKEEHTCNKLCFGELLPEIGDIFKHPLVGHSLFDRQVLNALIEHFDLGLTFSYTDSCAIAKEKLPNLKDHKLKTLAQYYKIPAFKHHDAAQDAVACASIFLKLHESNEAGSQLSCDDDAIFKGMVKGILADEEVNYKEAFALLYWLEDHPVIAAKNKDLYLKTKKMLSDNHLDSIEASAFKNLLEKLK